jgi:hypothetical protein
MEWYLPVIWAALIGTAVVMYVILDGFDLGIGILFPFARNESERDQMMRSVAPFWDGNETWLVLGGGGPWVAFPRAYAVVMPALYLPVIVMLLALVFRGVAFEFRTVSRSKTWLNVAFIVGSTLATFAQGVILGGLIQGIQVRDGAFAGGTFDWALRIPLRPIADRRLRFARCDLARDENLWSGRRPRPRAGKGIAAGGTHLHGRSESVDAAHAATHRRALVLAAEFLLPVAHSGDNGTYRLSHLALD